MILIATVFAIQDSACLVKLQQEQYPLFFNQLDHTLATGSLTLLEEGCGAAYVLYDAADTPRFIIKPADEDHGCINNPKGHKDKTTSPFLSAQKEGASYALAALCQLEDLIPFTTIGLLSHPSFFIDKEMGVPQEKKLCSIQWYLQDSINLLQLLKYLFLSGVYPEELSSYFAIGNFERMQLLLWILYDLDAHLGNFLVPYRSGAHPPYDLNKIDNSKTLPQENRGLKNHLCSFPASYDPISEELKTKIQELPLDKMEEILDAFALGDAIPALRQRVELLQQLILIHSITYYEINQALVSLEDS